MRALFLCTLSLAVVLSTAAWTAAALARSPSSAAIASAHRDVEIAEIELRRYVNIEYPSQRDHLETQMILARAEIEIQRRLVEEYERMSRGKTSKPFLVTLSDARIALLAAELSYQRNCDAKSRLEKFHGEQCRLHELRLEAALDRLAALKNAAAS